MYILTPNILVDWQCVSDPYEKLYIKRTHRIFLHQREAVATKI